MLKVVIYFIIIFANVMALPETTLSRSDREDKVRNCLTSKFGKLRWKDIIKRVKKWPKQVPMKDPSILSDEELQILEKSLDLYDAPLTEVNPANIDGSLNSVISSITSENERNDQVVNSQQFLKNDPENERPPPNTHNPILQDSLLSDLSYSDDSFEDSFDYFENLYSGDFDAWSIEDSIVYNKRKLEKERLRKGYIDFEDPL